MERQIIYSRLKKEVVGILVNFSYGLLHKFDPDRIFSSSPFTRAFDIVPDILA
ncbi:MAG TPA: hypothetical protein VJ110_00090 [Candidatus Nanoarchaeia archaeon]|nr:hypothetical protein [Candidatus Nanoarchaeia archaeon]